MASRDAAAVAAELHRLRSESRRVLQQQRRAQQEQSLSLSVKDTAVLVLWCSSGNRDICKAFLRSAAHKASQKKSKAKATVNLRGRDAEASRSASYPPAWQTAVFQTWDTWSAEDEQRVRVPDRPTAARLDRARLFVGDAALSAWVQDQNRKPLAPTGPAIRRLAPMGLLASRSAIPRAGQLTRTESRRLAARLRRWSRSKGVLQGRFKTGPALALDEARAKVFNIGQLVFVCVKDWDCDFSRALLFFLWA